VGEEGAGGGKATLPGPTRLVLRNTERMQAFFPGDAKSLAIHTNFSARCFS